jgi:hypothetical protein
MVVVLPGCQAVAKSPSGGGVESTGKPEGRAKRHRSEGRWGDLDGEDDQNNGRFHSDLVDERRSKKQKICDDAGAVCYGKQRAGEHENCSIVPMLDSIEHN